MEDFSLDHVGIVVPDLDHAFGSFQRLGFTLTSRSSHKLQSEPDGPFEQIGSGNHCVMFKQGYLELLGITDASKPHDSVTRRLERYTGLQLVALGCSDAYAVERVWRRVTDGCQPVVPLGRDVPLVGGGIKHGAFNNVYLSDEAVPEVELFAIEHLTPEVLWQDALLHHPNSAVGLQSVSIVSDEADVTASRVIRLGLNRTPGPHGDRFVCRDGGWIDVMSSHAAAKAFPDATPPTIPCAIASSYWVEELRTARDFLAGEGVDFEASRGRLRVPPDFAEGCIIDFVER
ncbi:MAG: VOC family protein [Pseudomonadota bacterium]